jgi:hypothetical protein
MAISRVEAGFIGGLGLACQYYPYVPVGAIRDSLIRIRAQRACSGYEQGLFVLLGSAAHGVTFDSMQWFARNAAACGLPAGVKVIAVGSETESLLPPGVSVPGLTLRGWMPQSELDDLLARVAGAVIPQRSGFGALTRLPELACAGIPVITFRHPSHAINPTPGLRIVDEQWADVCATLCEAARGAASISADEYDQWEHQQPRPLAETLQRVLNN